MEVYFIHNLRINKQTIFDQVMLGPNNAFDSSFIAAFIKRNVVSVAVVESHHSIFLVSCGLGMLYNAVPARMRIPPKALNLSRHCNG